jgi:signal transduction histidine kinase
MRVLAAVGALVVFGLLIVEVAMQPSATDRLTFLMIFATAAVATVVLAKALPRRLAGARSVRLGLVATPLLATAVAAGTVAAAAAGLMFLSAHDLRVFIGALSLGVGLAAVLSRSLSERLEADLRSLAATAKRVAAGDREVRSAIRRRDEIGDVAKAVDAMIEQLAAGEAARTRLLAALSHDLRTPLAAAQAAIEALQDGVAEDEERYLASIGRDIDVMADLVDDLFLLARLEARSIEFEAMPVDLAELADEAAEALGPVAARQGVAIDVIASGNTKVSGAPRELGRAIRNLLDNAVRHAPVSSRVRVELSNGGPFVTLRVVDAGPGFTPAMRLGAFEEFTTGDPARRGGGGGLGLAITRSIVDAHEGSLWIDDGVCGSVAMRLPVHA